MKFIKSLLKVLGVTVLASVALVAGAYYYFYYSAEISEPALPGEYAQHTLEVDKLQRKYSIYKPKNLQPNASVVFLLHGSNRNGDIVRRQSGYEFDLLAEKYGYIMVYPNGYEGHWNDCRKSATYSANRLDIDDPLFIKTIVEQLAGRYKANKAKVYVAGFSNGGHMAYRLAMEAPELVSAIAVIAANLPVQSNLDCKQSRVAKSVAIFNGTDDPINPFLGGMITVGKDISSGEVRSSYDTANFWLSLAKINDKPLITHFPQVDNNPNTSVAKYRWRNERAEIQMYKLQGSGHVIPSKIASFPRIVGPMAQDVSAVQEITQFFLNDQKQCCQLDVHENRSSEQWDQ